MRAVRCSSSARGARGSQNRWAVVARAHWAQLGDSWFWVVRRGGAMPRMELRQEPPKGVARRFVRDSKTSFVGCVVIWEGLRSERVIEGSWRSVEAREPLIVDKWLG